MNKKYDSIVIVWIVGGIIGIILSFILVIVCSNNPESELTLCLGKIIGPIDYSYIIAIPIGYFLIWTIFFTIIRKISNAIQTTQKTKIITNTPVSKVPAKVIFKSSATTSTHKHVSNTWLSVYDVLSITFEMQNGKRLVFPVTQEQYGLYLENDTGILTYKENDNQLIFINFERQI